MQSKNDKTINDIQFELNKVGKSGSNNYTSSYNRKWKLSQIKSLNTKALDTHLDNLKISGDSIQDMMLLHSNAALLIYVGTDGIVEIPKFDNIDELFRYKYFLVPHNSEPEYTTCKRHYDYFAILIASRLKNGLHDTNIISSNEKEVRSELDLNKKSFYGFEMILSVIQQLVPRLGNNNLSYDPATLVNSLKASPSGSYKIFHSKAQEIKDVLHCLKEYYGPHKLLLRYIEELNNTMNYKHAETILLIALRRHIQKHGNTQRHLFHHEYSLLTINIIREVIIEHRLDVTFQLYCSSSLVCKEVNISNNIHNNNNNNNNETDVNDMQPSAYNTNIKHHNNNRKFTLRPRCLVCILRHYGSDDADKCPYRGDAFRPDWMNIRIRKSNADHGSSPKKELKFLPPPPMEPTITKSKLQANKANASYMLNNDACKIENKDNDVYNAIGEEIVNAEDESNIQLKSLSTEIDTYGDTFLYCGKSSLQLRESIYESDSISNHDIEFSINQDASNAQCTTNTNIQSYVASSDQASDYTLSDLPKSDKLTTSSILMHSDSGSNAILVTSPLLLHNVKLRSNKVRNTGGGTAQTTHTGDLHMLLETEN